MAGCAAPGCMVGWGAPLPETERGEKKGDPVLRECREDGDDCEEDPKPEERKVGGGSRSPSVLRRFLCSMTSANMKSSSSSIRLPP